MKTEKSIVKNNSGNTQEILILTITIHFIFNLSSQNHGTSINATLHFQQFCQRHQQFLSKCAPLCKENTQKGCMRSFLLLFLCKQQSAAQEGSPDSERHRSAYLRIRFGCSVWAGATFSRAPPGPAASLTAR